MSFFSGRSKMFQHCHPIKLSLYFVIKHGRVMMASATFLDKALSKTSLLYCTDDQTQLLGFCKIGALKHRSTHHRKRQTEPPKSLRPHFRVTSSKVSFTMIYLLTIS